MIENLTSLRAWLHGIAAAAIGGAANSIGAALIKPQDFNLDKGLSNLLQLAGIGAALSVVAYLKQFPIPKGK